MYGGNFFTSQCLLYIWSIAELQQSLELVLIPLKLKIVMQSDKYGGSAGNLLEGTMRKENEIE